MSPFCLVHSGFRQGAGLWLVTVSSGMRHSLALKNEPRTYTWNGYVELHFRGTYMRETPH